MSLQAVKGTSVFKTLNPKFNVIINLHGTLTEAVLLKFAYTPLAEGTFGPRLDFPDKLEPAKKINYWRELPITTSARLWKNQTMPKVAVLVEEIKEGKFRFENALILEWPGGVRIAGEQPFGLAVLGRLNGCKKDGVFVLEGTEEQTEEQVVPIVPDLEEVEPELSLAPLNVENSPEYTGDKFKVDATTGHFIGDDGFRVPHNFEEFWERYPNYITNWVKKRLHKHVVDEDVEDWDMDLYTFLKYLPEKSKHRLPGANGREAGCTDVIETFNPVLQYGASEKRFRNYINNCLANRFNTIVSKRSKNPVCRPGNYSFSAQMDPDNYEVVDDEYVHSKSESLSHSSNKIRVQLDQRLFIREYVDFVEEHDASMIPVLHAIAETGTFGEAQRTLGLSEPDFNRARNRLKTLRDSFLNRTEVPKQRKPYKTRKMGEVAPELVS